jgi:hypothetical protein
MVLVPPGLAGHIEPVGRPVLTAALLTDLLVREVNETPDLPVTAAVGDTLGEI